MKKTSLKIERITRVYSVAEVIANMRKSDSDLDSQWPSVISIVLSADGLTAVHEYECQDKTATPKDGVK